MKKYLFVCLQNRARSPRAAAYFSNLIKERNVEASVESAGVFFESPKPLKEDMLDAADVIFAMDKEVIHRLKKEDRLKRKYLQIAKKIVDLDIPDAFDPYRGEFHPEWLDLSTHNPKEKNRYIAKFSGKTLNQALAQKRKLFESYI